MTARELLELNQMITDVDIEVREDGGKLIDALHIGMDYGIKPPYPLLVPDPNGTISNGGGLSRESTYIRKSINTWDDGKDYWHIKVGEIPKKFSELEVFSWRMSHVYKRSHPRADMNPAGEEMEGIRIVVVPDGLKVYDAQELLDQNGKQVKCLEGQIDILTILGE